MTLKSTDVAVIGGGVIGAAAAYYLSKAGQRVTLLERGGLSGEASGANLGLVTVFSTHSLEEPTPGPLCSLTQASVEGYHRLKEETGIDIEYDQSGGLYVVVEEAKLGIVQNAFQGYKSRGIPVEWLEPKGLRACEPAFSDDRLLAGVFCPANGYLNPMLATRAFAEGARRLGATVCLGTRVVGIRCAQGRVQGVQTTAGEVPCGCVVNAAGSWAAEIARMVGLEIPVVPHRGQVVLTERAPRLIRRIVMGAGISARQTRPGNVIIGSTEESVGFNTQVTASTVSQFAREILGHFPRLRQLSVIRTWAGLRPTTPDAAPIIELLQEPGGFCLAVGHSRRGVGYGPGTGQLVAALLTGARPFVSLSRFALHRFARQSATP